jgi:adenylate cyclase class 2
MSFLNVEIKARSEDPARIRAYLQTRNAEFRGVDEQTDTYFNVPNGRLKLREGNIENNLIYYQRDDQAGPKSSSFDLVKVPDAAGLKKALQSATGIRVVVKKRREIYFIDNVKFHIDEVDGLGTFIEIEAGNLTADLTKEQLLEQCNRYMKEMEVREADLIEKSYSDLLMHQPGLDKR